MNALVRALEAHYNRLNDDRFSEEEKEVSSEIMQTLWERVCLMDKKSIKPLETPPLTFEQECEIVVSNQKRVILVEKRVF